MPVLHWSVSQEINWPIDDKNINTDVKVVCRSQESLLYMGKGGNQWSLLNLKQVVVMRSWGDLQWEAATLKSKIYFHSPFHMYVNLWYFTFNME